MRRTRSCSPVPACGEGGPGWGAGVDLAGLQGEWTVQLVAWRRRRLLNKLADFRRQYRDADKRQVGREVSLQGGDSSATAGGGLAAPDLSPSGLAIEHEQTGEV